VAKVYRKNNEEDEEVEDEETTKSILPFDYNRIKIPLQLIRKQTPWVSRKSKGRQLMRPVAIHRKDLGSGIFAPTAKQVHLIVGRFQQRRTHAGNINSTALHACAFMLSQGSYLCARRFLWFRKAFLYAQKRRITSSAVGMTQ
jgi:hypothetical protein